MPRKNAILLTLSQVILGGAIGLAAGWICLTIFEKLLWGVIITDRVQHGFLAGLFLLISFGVTYGITVAAVAESVRVTGLKFGTHIARKGAYQGAFLGAPAIVALMSLLNIHWEQLIPPNLLVALLLPVFQFLAFVLSLPLRILLSLRCPPELLYVVAAPLGAILGYRFSRSTDRSTQPLAEEH